MTKIHTLPINSGWVILLNSRKIMESKNKKINVNISYETSDIKEIMSFVRIESCSNYRIDLPEYNVKIDGSTE